jgi:hypothetical protein
MLKLLLVFPILLVASIVLGAGALAFLPLLVLLPVVLAVGLTIGALFVALRVIAFIIFAIGGIALAGAGMVTLVVGGAFALAAVAVVAHLFIPILLIAAIVWLLHRSAKPAQIAHG